MAFYEYTCPQGCRFDIMRRADQRDLPALCPSHGRQSNRVYSVPVIHWPRSLWTQWGDIHTKSAREMAHDPNIERYDPTGPIDPVKVDTRAGIQATWKEAIQQQT